MKNNVFLNKACRSILFMLLSLFAGTLYAQQDAQYTQYMYNTVSVNPGYAGSRGHLSIAALYRAQWVGLDGAPKTQTLNFHTPMGYGGAGIGLSIVNDQIGPTSETYFDVDFSYSVKASDEAKISFGVKASGHLLDIRFSELNQDYTNPGGPDPTLQQDIENKFSPNVGAGIYYHTDKFYAGLSVPRILETSHFESSSLSTANEQMNYYVITGYVWDVSPLWKFKPTILAKVVNGAPLQLDFSANAMFNEKFIIGAAYRWDAAISGLAGFQISPELMIGVAYDREITELGSAVFNDGSFEVILRYDFIRILEGMKSPRFF